MNIDKSWSYNTTLCIQNDLSIPLYRTCFDNSAVINCNVPREWWGTCPVEDSSTSDDKVQFASRLAGVICCNLNKLKVASDQSILFTCNELQLLPQASGNMFVNMHHIDGISTPQLFIDHIMSSLKHRPTNCLGIRLLMNLRDNSRYIVVSYWSDEESMRKGTPLVNEQILKVVGRPCPRIESYEIKHEI